jgi:hypothetical protein
MKQVKIIYESEPVGIGSTILRGLHRLYYATPEEILYFHFTNILYGDKNQNIWSTYIEQPFVHEKEFILHEFNNKRVVEEHGVFLKKTNPFLFCYGKAQNYAKDFLNKELVTKFRQVFTTYVKIKSSIHDKANLFCKEFIDNNRVVSMQKRGTDNFTTRGHAGDIIAFADEEIKKIVKDNLEDYDYLFLATDEIYVRNLLIKYFGNKILSYSTMLSPEGDKRGTHFANINNTTRNKYTLGEEAIIDSLIMSRCDYSLCMKSNLSLINILLRNNFNYHFIDDHVQYDY